MSQRSHRDTRQATTVCLCWFHPLVLADFRRVLSGNGLRVCERRLDPAAIRDHAMPRLPKASVYLLEGQPDGAWTVSAVAWLLGRRPGARLIVVAEGFDQKSAFGLLRLGVKGLLSFREAPAHLRRAVREVARDGFWVSRTLLSRFIDSAVRSLKPQNPHLLVGSARLSRREHEVCELLLANLSNREIASRLQVSERTAKFHVANLLGKYGLKRRADLVVLSYSRFLEASPHRGGGSPARPTAG